MFDRHEMRESLEEFARLYDERPIKNNRFATRSPHLFALWFLLKKLKPTHVIESGVMRGQSTWLIEKARPEAALFCIDLNFNSLVYRSKTATYLTKDFVTHSWEALPKETTLLF